MRFTQVTSHHMDALTYHCNPSRIPKVHLVMSEVHNDMVKVRMAEVMSRFFKLSEQERGELEFEPLGVLDDTTPVLEGDSVSCCYSIYLNHLMKLNTKRKAV